MDSYREPTSYEWQWGSDDGGDVIKTLQVQRQLPYLLDEVVINCAKSSAKVKKLYQAYGYSVDDFLL